MVLWWVVLDEFPKVLWLESHPSGWRGWLSKALNWNWCLLRFSFESLCCVLEWKISCLHRQ
jgi:hypothetical protein